MRRLISTGSLRRSKPQTYAVPALGCRMPVNILRVVDLPAPLGPRKPTICPGSTLNESASTATCVAKRLDSVSRTIAGSLIAAGIRG